MAWIEIETIYKTIWYVIFGGQIHSLRMKNKSLACRKNGDPQTESTSSYVASSELGALVVFRDNFGLKTNNFQQSRRRLKAPFSSNHSINVDCELHTWRLFPPTCLADFHKTTETGCFRESLVFPMFPYCQYILESFDSQAICSTACRWFGHPRGIKMA